MGITKKQFARYITTASALAEHVKRCLTKEGIIDNKAVLALNDFIIAANEVNDTLSQLTNEDKSPNIKLN